MAMAEVTELRDGSGPEWLPRAAFMATVALLVAAVAAVAVIGGGERSVDERLAKIRAFVGSAQSVRFTGASVMQDGDPEGPGSSFTDRTALTGELVLPDTVHVLADSGDYLDETISNEAGSYERSGDSRAELAGEKWVHYPNEAEAAEEHTWVGSGPVSSGMQREMLAAASSALELTSGYDLRGIVDHIEEVERVSETVLRGTIRPFDLLSSEERRQLDEFVGQMPAEERAAFQQFVDHEIVVELTHQADGTVDGVSVTSERDEDDFEMLERTELRFTDWGAPITIVAPAHDAIDHTPSVDEEGLAAFTAFPLVAPKPLPEPWRLVSATVVEEDADEGECAGVDLEWADPTTTGPPTEEGPDLPDTISIALRRLGCPDLEDVPTADHHVTVAGRRAAVVAVDDLWNASIWSEDGSGTGLVLDLEGTRVEIASDLDEKTLLPLLARFVPFRLADHPVADAHSIIDL